MYAGGYGQEFGDASFVPSYMLCCFLLVIYEDIFPPEAMQKFFCEICILSRYLNVDHKFRDASFVPSYMLCCILLVTYEDIFSPEAMEKFFCEI